MKVSMMTYTMARGVPKGEKFDVKALCDFTLQLKIEAVDWVTLYGYDAREIRKTMDDRGLKTCCHTFFAEFNLPTRSERAAGHDQFKRGIEAAVALGTNIVMLPLRGNQAWSREQSYRNNMDGLTEVIDFADKAGVTVSIENFPSWFGPFVTSADVNKAVKELPQVRVTFDNGNVTTGGEPAPDGFTNSAPYVVHAHFKDWKLCEPDAPGAMKGLDGKYRRAVLVGDGDVDQVGCVKAMKKYGYKGYVNFEYEGREFTPRDATIEGVRRMKEWFATA